MRLAWLLPTLLLPILLTQPLRAQDSVKPPHFYRDLDYGSEAGFNPLTSAINWSFDTLQIPQSFDDRDWGPRWLTVRKNLTDPNQAIAQRGGWGAFVNRQVLPYRMTEPDWVPNYGLHLLGGGMLFRKRAEWFEAHDVPMPYLCSGMISLAEELVGETVEKASTKPDDEVADVLIFLPASMLLFSSDRVARFASQRLDLMDWPYQPMVDPSAKRPWGSRGRIVNAGQNFAMRPNLFGSKDHRAFAFIGMTNLAGMSHKLDATDSLSWGLGAAMVQSQDPTVVRGSAGVFWDRNGSLLASLILNGTDELAVRLNVYPGVMGSRSWWSPGLYVGLGDRGDLNVGFTLRILPLGWARTAPEAVR